MGQATLFRVSFQNREQRLHNLSGQPVPPVDCPRGEKVFAYNPSGSLLFQFVPIVLHPLTMYRCEKVGSFLDNFLIGTKKLLLAAHKASSSLG